MDLVIERESFEANLDHVDLAAEVLECSDCIIDAIIDTKLDNPRRRRHRTRQRRSRRLACGARMAVQSNVETRCREGDSAAAILGLLAAPDSDVPQTDPQGTTQAERIDSPTQSVAVQDTTAPAVLSNAVPMSSDKVLSLPVFSGWNSEDAAMPNGDNLLVEEAFWAGIEACASQMAHGGEPQQCFGNQHDDLLNTQQCFTAWSPKGCLLGTLPEYQDWTLARRHIALNRVYQFSADEGEPLCKLMQYQPLNSGKDEGHSSNWHMSSPTPQSGRFESEPMTIVIGNEYILSSTANPAGVDAGLSSDLAYSTFAAGPCYVDALV
eukprot:TRINITY_DN21516_c0_g2_i1.p1 TRINITY_DN21516_c0_g2~~TRINITY_DN21516_c0_g2_i1.p1  ORF type:complete len:346 (-),score=29.67 TRINITY_DN21516_c0_g2_i1:253-1221(-)